MSLKISDDKLEEIVTMFEAKDGEVLKIEDIGNLSSTEIKNYFDDTSVVLKLFVKSSGKSGNNKPYIFNKRLTINQALAVVEKLSSTRKIKDSFFDDIFED
jgi:hypothetical protein